jgi:hypothetical protein
MIAIMVAVAQYEAMAQSAPATPSPQQGGQPNDPAFPPVSNPPVANLGTAPINALTSERQPVVAACMNEFVPLREEATRRGKLIKDASYRHAGPVEACRLIGSYSDAEIKLISYLESHATTCSVPSSIAERFRSSHKSTEALRIKICAVAKDSTTKRQPAGPVGDFDLVR